MRRFTRQSPQESFGFKFMDHTGNFRFPSFVEEMCYNNANAIGLSRILKDSEVISVPKLIIQIPCYNEETTLALTLADLPAQISGVDRVETLIVDDGCTDKTIDVARKCGVNHIIALPRHQGLAKAFMAGIEGSLKAGADVIVNVDADNQYCADDIPKLVCPILDGKAEIVIGARPVGEIAHFSPIKKLLQRLGSWVVRRASKTDIADAASGFRAMSRKAAMRLHVFSEYSYTLETIIQAGQKSMAITSVPVRVNPDTRPSRLINSLPAYLQRQISTIVRIFMTYRPFHFFAVPGVLIFFAGLIISLRFLYFYITAGGEGHVQSLILSALLLGAGFFLIIVGLLADLIGVNRNLLEQLDWKVQEIEEKVENEPRQ
jgi:glycosyltransferase involved in cell wall biosynthesis